MHQVSIKKILCELKEGIGYLYIERTLELESGILVKLERGKKVKERAVLIALLKIINAFPWMLEVAANQYKNANQALVYNVLVKPEEEIQEKIISKTW